MKTSALGHMGQRCPFPNCGHVGDFITKVHCRIHHGMEREELFKKYGKPVEVRFNMKKINQNLRMMNEGYVDAN